MTFTQRAFDGGTCNTATEFQACSGRTISSAGGAPFKTAENGGTPGSVADTFGAQSSGTNVAAICFDLIVAAGVTWDAGTWTTRLNITTSNMNLTITEIHICRANSSCANQATIGSATGLSISLGTTGVKSQDVTGVAQTPGAGDKVLIVYVISNGAMSTQSAGFTPDQNFDSPFTVPAPVGPGGLHHIGQGWGDSGEGARLPQTLHKITEGITCQAANDAQYRRAA